MADNPTQKQRDGDARPRKRHLFGTAAREITVDNSQQRSLILAVISISLSDFVILSVCVIEDSGPRSQRRCLRNASNSMPLRQFSGPRSALCYDSSARWMMRREDAAQQGSATGEFERVAVRRRSGAAAPSHAARWRRRHHDDVHRHCRFDGGQARGRRPSLFRGPRATPQRHTLLHRAARRT